MQHPVMYPDMIFIFLFILYFEHGMQVVKMVFECQKELCKILNILNLNLNILNCNEMSFERYSLKRNI